MDRGVEGTVPGIQSRPVSRAVRPKIRTHAQTEDSKLKG